MIQHGSCAALHGAGVLFLGPPGSGKSDLVLRLLRQGWTLVADDQVVLEPTPTPGETLAHAPESLAGMLELRGLGLVEGLPHAPAPLRLVVELRPQGEEIPRLPEPRHHAAPGGPLPALRLHGFEASAPARLEMALATLGLGPAPLALRAGAFGGAFERAFTA
ncbi:hypothetical protein NON00_05585 [Roseomonas sp. GC11]|uniref:HPr kinase/phosphorylase n=1 Tax=Roseomonas sp. GC11 TaxID=2950546 RepID=UPI00210F12C9|nr:hypothetical protein [Roseomonas sp. GC11]MCQ4159393.1 hypothetical protein [Roseomonas sp. GC11]